jgi:hypothetical protein
VVRSGGSVDRWWCPCGRSWNVFCAAEPWRFDTVDNALIRPVSVVVERRGLRAFLRLRRL